MDDAPPPANPSQIFRKLAFSDLPGWNDCDHATAFAAFRRCAVRALEKPYRTGALGVRADSFEPAFAEARSSNPLTQEEAQSFFARHFTPAIVNPSPSARGFVTGFYEPVVAASPVADDRFRFPLYARPDDLIDVDETNRPADMDPYLVFGRETTAGIVAFFDRSEIEQGALRGRGLEIAWLEDPVDVFFIHVQGAARLEMPDGAVRRVTYAAKSGHRFTGPGRILLERGELPAGEVAMQSIRGWLRDNPDRVDELLWQNRSFIFFREARVDDPDLGPVAAAKVPLTPGCSLAVDRFLHTFATPFLIDAPTLEIAAKPFRRLMVAQETGSAITGPARGDLFIGSGDSAGEIAGKISHPADFYALLPKSLMSGAD